MIAVDTNILVYAHRLDSPWNQRAFECVQELVAGTKPWLLPWPCLHEFLGVVTHPRVYRPPTTIDDAVKQVEFWLESPSVVLGAESHLYWPTLRPLLKASNLSGALIHDARIAAICLEHGADVLWSADRDFSRFPSLQTENPLVSH